MTAPRPPAPASPRVLVVQHVALEGPGAIAARLGAEGVAVDVVRVDRGAAVPRGADGYAGLVVMGGPMGVYEAERHPFLRDELALLERFLGAGRPILGVCLGSQLLAAALGARVYASGGQEIGWAPVELEAAGAEDPLLGAAPRTFTPLHWHGDVFDLPAGAVRLARSERTAIQAYRHGASAWGLLFHLEADAAQVAAMAEAFAEDLRRAGVDGGAIVAEAGARLAALAPVREGVLDAWCGRVRAGGVRAAVYGGPFTLSPTARPSTGSGRSCDRPQTTVALAAPSIEITAPVT